MFCNNSGLTIMVDYEYGSYRLCRILVYIEDELASRSFVRAAILTSVLIVIVKQ